jgi:hypothetical protein
MADSKPTATKDDFHRERSRFIDAFARLEEALFRMPKAAADKQLSEQLKVLRSIRNDLVHSQMRFIALEGQLHALALNVQDMTDVARQGRLLRLEDFFVLANKIEEARRKVSANA